MCVYRRVVIVSKYIPHHLHMSFYKFAFFICSSFRLPCGAVGAKSMCASKCFAPLPLEQLCFRCLHVGPLGKILFKKQNCLQRNRKLLYCILPLSPYKKENQTKMKAPILMSQCIHLKPLNEAERKMEITRRGHWGKHLASTGCLLDFSQLCFWFYGGKKLKNMYKHRS